MCQKCKEDFGGDVNATHSYVELLVINHPHGKLQESELNTPEGRLACQIRMAEYDEKHRPPRRSFNPFRLFD